MAFEGNPYPCGGTALVAFDTNTYSYDRTALAAFEVNSLPLWLDCIGGVEVVTHTAKMAMPTGNHQDTFVEGPAALICQAEGPPSGSALV